MAFPPAHILVGVGVAELVRVATPLPRWKAWVIAGALAVSPDLDFGVGMLMGDIGSYHGTFTHSAFAVIVVSLVAALAGRGWGVLAGAAYASHLVVDLLDDRGQTNVLLGWPLTEARPDAMARVFPTVPLPRGDGLLGTLASLLEAETFLALLHQSAVGALFFIVLVAWSQGMVLISRCRER